ncbi:MAG: TonB-dependent receptor plug domain-containing protein [Alphaproteobacteria bacterium]|nr:TonB-dependent receptor plug domain-containing protein [Alphaproteobacteria bacterium]
MNPTTARFATLMGSASLLALTNALTANAQQAAQAVQVSPQQFAQAQVAQAAPEQTAQAAPEAVPEQVLVTGSLIHGTAAVGVPVTNLGVQDFTQTGAVTIADLFRTVPVANVAPGPSSTNSGGHQERETRVNIRGLDQTGPRSLLMVDGVRFPPQADGLCAIDPSIIPALALDRVDILADGASATYGSDAIAGVINIVLKRGFDGAVTLAHVQVPTDGGGVEYQASQLWGRTWDGGDITLTYEWTDDKAVTGNIHSKFTTNFLPWGLQDPFVGFGASVPGTVSTGAPHVVSSLGVGTQVPALVNGTCTNCFSIPKGTGANWTAAADAKGPGGASTISWAALMGNAGANNFVDPLSGTGGWEQGAQQKNSFVMTVDQRLFPGVSFFGTGFYANRRVEDKLPSFGGQGLGTYLTDWKVPTINPYYPAGAPSGLRVGYDLADEVTPSIPAWEVSERYQFGLNLDLPFAWNGQIYESRSFEDVGYIRHYISTAGVNAALGNNGAQAVNPATGAPIPFLNLFCDPLAFRCNSPTTLNYIGATRTQNARWAMEEKGAKFDGPLFDLPAGQVKAAVGATYESDSVSGCDGSNAGTPGNLPLGQFITCDPEPYHVWAYFGQLDIPVFGDNLNFPLMRKLDLEGSWRYDQYGGNPVLTGITRNPKFSFTWLVDELVGATVRGSWGTSFRFANEGEFSNVLSPVDNSINFPTSGTGANIQCINGAATAGSTAAALVAAGVPCGSAPGGFSYGGGPEPALRIFTNAQGQTVTRENGLALAPEKATNYSVGFELAPTIDFLRGLDLQATWYSVKVNGLLSGQLAAGNTTGLNDPNQRFHFIVPSDTGCPVADNNNPAACAPFQKMVLAAINDPAQADQLTPADATSVYFINDSATANSGFLHVTGVDFNGSYDYDAGDLGAYNVGITGTYYLHRWLQTSSGGKIIDTLDQNIASVGGLAQNGVETLPRMIWRARAGWSDGPVSFTVFWNHQGHYFETHTSAPPNVNFQCTTSGGTLGGGSMPCAISNFSYIQPAFDTFDLSFGYNTGDMPANDYLKRITLQLTVNNLMGMHAPFEYGPNASTRNPSGFSLLAPDYGRVIGLTLVKNW